MKRLLATSALISLVAGAAMAADPLVDNAQNTLDRYDVPVDASTLTDNQLARLHFLETSDQSRVEVENQIEAIVNYDDGAGVPMPPLGDPLVADAQNTLDRYGYDNVDATDLSDMQIAQLHFLETDSDQTEVEVRNSIQGILQ